MTKFDPKPTARKSTKDPKTVSKAKPDEDADEQSQEADKGTEVAKKRPKRNYGPVEVTVKQCKVCMSPDRYEIEKLIILGMSQRKVIEFMKAAGQSFNKNSMSNHVRKHMSLKRQAVRRMIERQAAKQFENIEETADTLLTTRGILEVMRQRGAEQIIEGNVNVEPETLIRVMDKIDGMDSSEESEKLQEMMIELNCLLRAVQSVVPEPTWKQITQQFQSNLEAAQGKMAALPTPKKEAS